MTFQKGDIIYCYFPLPNQKEIKNHPFLVLSNEELFDEHEIYIGIMLTHMNSIDEYTYELTNDMFVKSPNDNKFMQARLQFITYLEQKSFSATRPFCKLKNIFLEEIIREVKNII